MTQLCSPWDWSLHFLHPTTHLHSPLLFISPPWCYSILLYSCYVQPPELPGSVRNDRKQMEARDSNRGYPSWCWQHYISKSTERIQNQTMIFSGDGANVWLPAGSIKILFFPYLKANESIFQKREKQSAFCSFTPKNSLPPTPVQTWQVHGRKWGVSPTNTHHDLYTLLF